MNGKMINRKTIIFLNKIAREIHKMFAIATFILGSAMTLTGLILKFPQLSKLPFIDPSFSRFLHNALSPFFAVALILMMVTGVFMYVFPWLLKKLG